MEARQKIPTVILDPYLLMSMTAILPAGALAACLCARFAICDHLLPGDFLPEEYKHLMEAIDQENIETLSVPAMKITDLLPLRNVLVLYQIATIAAARCHGCMFASDCCILRRAATTVLMPARILCGRQVCLRFHLN